MREAAEEGISVAGQGGLAGTRLTEMRDFYDYLWRELPALIDRWRDNRGDQ